MALLQGCGDSPTSGINSNPPTGSSAVPNNCSIPSPIVSTPIFAYIGGFTGATGSPAQLFELQQSATGALVPLLPPSVPTGCTGCTYLGVPVVHPSRKFVYDVVDEQSVVTYDRDLTTGLLTMVNPPIIPGNVPFAAVASLDGNFLYVTNQGSRSLTNLALGNIVRYAIDQNSGALTPVGTPTPASGASFAALSPDGKFLYVSGASTTSAGVAGVTFGFTVNSNGDLNPIPGSPFNVGRIILHPNGRFAYSNVTGSTSTIVQWDIDPLTGALQPSNQPALTTVGLGDAVAVDPTGSFLFATQTNLDWLWVYSIDPTTGSLSQLSNLPLQTGHTLSSLAFDGANSLMYAGNSRSAPPVYSVYSVRKGCGVTEIPGSPFASAFTPVSISLTR